MIFIDRANKTPSPDWLNRADSIAQLLLNAPNEQERNIIIDANEGLWGELKDFLFDISYGKCWYSESKENYSHLHVDHYRPKKKAIGLDKKDKGGYWWLAFKWQNYRLCGNVGNVRKKDKFPVKTNKATTPNCNIEDEIPYFLDPTEFEDTLKITFNCAGEMMPIDNNGWHYEQAQYTIKHLNLNFGNLKEARKIIWMKCHSLIIEIQGLMDLDKLNPSAFRRGQIKEKLSQLREMSNKKSVFSATAAACLKSSGILWAMGCAA
jgi:uncharacterized protein (TIGR02646 family)